MEKVHIIRKDLKSTYCGLENTPDTRLDGLVEGHCLDFKQVDCGMCILHYSAPQNVGIGMKVVQALRDKGIECSTHISHPRRADERVAEIIENASGVNELVAALSSIVDATEKWNAAVETIIGKQPNTGIGLAAAQELLKKYIPDRTLPKGDSEMIKAMLHERSQLEDRLVEISKKRPGESTVEDRHYGLQLHGAIQATGVFIEIARKHSGS